MITHSTRRPSHSATTGSHRRAPRAVDSAALAVHTAAMAQLRVVLDGVFRLSRPCRRAGRLWLSDFYTHRALSALPDGSNLRTEAEVHALPLHGTELRRARAARHPRGPAAGRAGGRTRNRQPATRAAQGGGQQLLTRPRRSWRGRCGVPPRAGPVRVHLRRGRTDARYRPGTMLRRGTEDASRAARCPTDRPTEVLDMPRSTRRPARSTSRAPSPATPWRCTSPSCPGPRLRCVDHDPALRRADGHGPHRDPAGPATRADLDLPARPGPRHGRCSRPGRSDFRVELPTTRCSARTGSRPPAARCARSLVPDKFGGNMDTPEMRALQNDSVHLR